MNCAAFESLIALYVEGDLPESEGRRVEIHLQACTACRDMAEDLKQSQFLFKSLRAGTVNSSDLAGVRERVLNEVGELDPAPGWVVTMHRLILAGLRRRNAIAGIALAVLVSGSVWYSQKRAVTEIGTGAKSETRAEEWSPGRNNGRNDVPVEVAKLDVPAALLSPVRIPPAVDARLILNRAVMPETLAEAPPEATEPAIAASFPDEIQVSQIPMKFVTDDPDIIIYWLPADKGD